MNKTVIITGAAGNLGRAVVKNFLDKDYKVIAVDNVGSPVNKLDSHSNLETHEVNAMSEKEANDFIQTIITKHGKIDAACLLIGGFAIIAVRNLCFLGIYIVKCSKFSIFLLLKRYVQV